MTDARIRKVKVLKGVAKTLAFKKALKPDDLVVVTTSIEKIEGDAVSYLMKHSEKLVLDRQIIVDAITILEKNYDFEIIGVIVKTNKSIPKRLKHYKVAYELYCTLRGLLHE